MKFSKNFDFSKIAQNFDLSQIFEKFRFGQHFRKISIFVNIFEKIYILVKFTSKIDFCQIFY